MAHRVPGSHFEAAGQGESGQGALASKLRQETTLTLGEIAQRLQMGSKKSLSAKLHQWRKTHEHQI